MDKVTKQNAEVSEATIHDPIDAAFAREWLAGGWDNLHPVKRREVREWMEEAVAAYEAAKRNGSVESSQEATLQDRCAYKLNDNSCDLPRNHRTHEVSWGRHAFVPPTASWGPRATMQEPCEFCVSKDTRIAELEESAALNRAGASEMERDIKRLTGIMTGAYESLCANEDECAKSLLKTALSA